MSQAHPPEPINWRQVINTQTLPELDGSVREQGIQFHEWLAQCFETDAVPFERDLDWLTDPSETGGRFDCFDGHYVYEFKTVIELPDTPRRKDVDQLQRYLNTLDAAHGVLVYVERGGFSVSQFFIE